MSLFDPTLPDQPIKQISNPSVRGVTTGKTRSAGTTVFVQIETGVNDKKFVPLDDLELQQATGNGIEDLLTSLRFGSKGDLARLLTFHKISSNLSNVFYAMQASRTDFYAYQFKPVYKFIESLTGRILIADEVGLGKTIEAGLIWLETKARRAEAKRLLVVCPSMLREKWKKELREKFDTRAEIYDARGFLALLEDFRRETTNFQCAAVVSLNSVRQDAVQDALEELKHSPLRFDLVIIDEAHHLRNSETKSHRVGQLLSDVSESMVLLTATPVHLGSEDLFRLLRLLDADEFGNLELFRQQIAENEPIIRAQNLLRRHPPKIEQARREIELLEDSFWFNESALELVRERLARLTPENQRELVEIGRLLENLNLFGATISRTRKREVRENRVLREARALELEFSEREAEFYRRVTEAVQNRVNSYSGASAIAAFSLMMPQRQMASCIPAMVEHYRQNFLKAAEIDEETLEEMGVSADEFENENPHSNLPLELEQLIADWDLKTPDSKFARLLEALRNRFEREPEAKIIIFSYFKKTLSYLHRRLTDENFAPLVIHGDVPMEERLAAIEIFRENPMRRILLSSEVGSEGIDLQFCRIIVNYDLPWNPMKVEQRIGRVDRLGQKAEKITILNFSVRDTIEEKILERLYHRIGIFEQSLGELEPILGELTQQLTHDLLSRRLNPAQIEERIAQTERALENNRQQEEELVEQSAIFLGSSDYILEQIGLARELGRWITPENISSFITDFFNSSYVGTNINWDAPEPGLVKIKLTNEARNDLNHFSRMQNPPQPTILAQGGEAPILAFRPEAAQKNSRAEMLTHFHPLVRWICSVHRNNKNAFFPVSAVELRTETAPPGEYLIAVQFWEFDGKRKKLQIVYDLAALDNAQKPLAIEPEKLLGEILESGESWQYADQIVSKDALLAAWDDLIARLSAAYDEEFRQFQRENEILFERHKNHLESHSLRRVEQLTKSIQTLREKNAPEWQIKKFQNWLANERSRLTDALAKLKRESQTSHNFTDIAAVVCRVKT